MNVLVLADDLFFASQILAAARQAGAHCEQSSLARFLDEPPLHDAQRPCDLLLVDLTAPDAQERISQCVQLCRGPGKSRPAIIAFAPHLHHARLEAARTAGCDRVLTRGQLHRELPQLFVSD